MASLLPSLSSDDENNLNASANPSDEEDSSDDEMNADFEFGGILGEDGGLASSTHWVGSLAQEQGWSYKSALELLEKQDGKKESSAPKRMEVASLIEAKRRHLNVATKNEELSSSSSDDSESSSDDSADDTDDDSDNDSNDDHADAKEMEADVLKTRAGKDDESGKGDEDVNNESEYQSEGDEEEEAKAAAFFDTQQPSGHEETVVFAQLNLSRPLLRGVAAMGFVRPTSIQAAVIPVALVGRDVCASAVTGSGKTGAFVLPILERILHRGAIRGIICIILTPTRELAAQCLGMLTTLATYTKIRSTLVVGGAKNVNAQAAELRARPDVVVATPGRLLDHITNSPGVSIDDVEFLVLDEADRLLDLGFQEEVHEIVKSCPTQRQTMLFSATMTTKVDDLVNLSLKRPVRIKVTDKNCRAAAKEVEVAPRLEQEFVRVRAGNEGVNREGMLLALLTRTFTTRTIVFFDTKSSAHRLMIICGLCGIKCAELHGNLTQMQRLTALDQFRNGQVDILLATDLAARGLDIDSVAAVVNFEMPNQIETYVHRIGRTARAGRGGQSCTLIGEGRRHLMKEVIKDAKGKSQRSKQGRKAMASSSSGVIRSRTIPSAVVFHFVAKINSLEEHVKEVLEAESVARLDRIAEMEATKAKNIIEHSDEIKARPQREWFASNHQKQNTKAALAERQKMFAEKAGTGNHRMTRKKRRAREAMEQLRRFQEEEQEEREAAGKKPKKVVNEGTIKSKARAYKREEARKENEKYDKSIREEDSRIAKKQAKRAKQRKDVTASDYVGDGGLFDEEKVTFKKAKLDDKAEVQKSQYQLDDYDARMTRRKNKKKSVNSFKSKSKYKRR